MGRYPSEADDDATLTDRELIIRLRAQLAQARAAARVLEILGTGE